MQQGDQTPQLEVLRILDFGQSCSADASVSSVMRAKIKDDTRYLTHEFVIENPRPSAESMEKDRDIAASWP